MTTVEITTSGLALGQPDPGLILPPFDVATPNKLFVLRTDGISIVNFGTVLPPGLSVDELQNELNIIGSLATGGGLGDVRVRLSFIPEPTTSVLLVTALCPLVMLRRRQR